MTNVKKFKARAICLIVMAVMLFGMFPFAAFAAANNVTGTEVVISKNGETGIFTTIVDATTSKDKYSEEDCVKMTVASGKSSGRFSLKGSVSGYQAPNSAKTTMLWSMDVLIPSTSKDFKSINLTTDGGETMVKSLKLSEIGEAGKWHNLSIIYQPGTNGTDCLGTASLFVDGKYVDSKNLGNLTTIGTNPRGKEYRTIITSDANSPIYLDNILLAEAEKFTPPCVSSGINADSYMITGYGDVTVADEKTAMATALDIDSGNISIKSASGEDVSDESFVAPGMKAVTEVNVSTTNFTDPKTYNVEYTFGVQYKLLTSIINPTVGSNVSSYINDQVGIKSPTIVKEKLGGKDESDTYMKFTSTTSNDNYSRFAILSNNSKIQCNAGKVLILSADMFIASADIENFECVKFMRSGGSSNSGQLSVSDFKPEQWNKILYVLYNDGNQYYGDVYLNGELKQAGYHDSAKTTTGDLRFCVKYKNDGKSFYIDNLYVATADSFERPEISTDEYVARVIVCQDGRIDGYKDMTVGAIKTASGLDGKVYTADGAEVTDESAKAEKGMYFVAEKDLSDTSKYGFYAGKYSYKYVLKTAGYSFGAWSAKLGDTALTDNTYSSAGKLAVECDVENFLTTPVKGIAILAEFDSDGNLAGIRNTQNFSVAKGGTDKISLTYDIPNDTTGTFKAFVWNSFDEIMPLKDMLTISHK